MPKDEFLIHQSRYSQGVLDGTNASLKAKSYAQGVVDGAKAKEMALEARRLVDAGEFEKEIDAIRHLYRR
ncbi:hypothetical protein [Vibrio parahaemolyticus]|uniref:hypothetical protein n=1 Tax=Vibrio parahaemolyticus TaxID=670 RepID=UPI0004DF33DF|nr:hypothetical protein [Vibrio parahaemolyticus]MBD6945210.1 hypothetical protein [Vibrio parahaemolyticus]MBD6979596.1 hypothetical protein [Vibrio parahaemolyticus]MBD6992404.1 hypothetical protein [Vibrio parahaemolyticus]MCX8804717.1 hypothetical protein [Vibrio parahaemolyticus]MCX8809505.1 hypothetical protein [Vibrio parahaemolyticus]